MSYRALAAVLLAALVGAGAVYARVAISKAPAERAVVQRVNGGDAPMDAAALAGIWNVIEIDGTPVAEGVAATLDFRGDMLGGSTGCNSFSASVGLIGDRLQLGPVATTRRGCSGDAQKTEVRFLRALQFAGAVRSGGDGMLSLVQGDRVLMRARR